MKELAHQVVAAARQANAKLALIDLDPEEDFYAQGLDSLDHIQILMKVEEIFGFKFGDADYDLCNSLEGIEAHLRGMGFG